MAEHVLDLPGGRLVCRRAGSGPLVVLTHAIGPPAWGDVSQLATSCTVATVDWEKTTADRGVLATWRWFEP
ncbi:MAG: hypothetical protein ACF8XB_10320, partial [Planctomycetota bacterium JB042]